ncbi:MAG TPA: gamma-glutamyl-gamma-aminobutyrate hydrolase family protein [Tepidisphaeraceae bacterium]|nr:gamma-glutamyl-gamma-aminobutyrate hydrolase family protein [Tepidisphaeraceae bacterium]
MSKAIVLQHVEAEGPGRILPVFRDFGIPVEVRKLYKGDEVPSDLDELRVLIVLGGPMGVADVGKPEYPWLAQEVELLKKCVMRDRAVLGICLGAQLLAHAAGAKVYPNVKMVPGEKHGDPPKPAEPLTPLPEIGWAPVLFPFPGGTEPIAFGLSDGAMMFHWHFDTFDLPKLPGPANPAPPPAPPPPTGNALISTTKVCKNQVYRFKNRLFGFQYHIECTPEIIRAMVAQGKADIDKVLGPGGEAQIHADTEKHYAKYERLTNRVLGNFVQFLKVY